MMQSSSVVLHVLHVLYTVLGKLHAETELMIRLAIILFSRSISMSSMFSSVLGKLQAQRQSYNYTGNPIILPFSMSSMFSVLGKLLRDEANQVAITPIVLPFSMSSQCSVLGKLLRDKAISSQSSSLVLHVLRVLCSW